MRGAFSKVPLFFFHRKILHMSQVHTTKGLIDRDLLEAKDIITDEDNARVVATEWFLGEELVRRDVAVSILRGQSLVSEQEVMG